MKGDLTQLSAVQAAGAMRAAQLSSEALVEAYLAQIEQTDETIRAWVWLDNDYALEQAREADRIRRAGRATGALHGVPVGLKDIVDTTDMPTQRGTPIFSNRQADADARSKPEYLDTWAAAYAANGDFRRAISLQEEAVALASQDEYAGVRDVLEEHLEAFQKGETITETAP